MSRTACRISAAALALAVLLCCLSGCGQLLAGNTAAGGREQNMIDKGVLLVNNIGISEKTVVQNDEYEDDCVEISGLADKTVQDKINGRITEVFESMQNGEFVPPYRGMALKLKQYGDYSSNRYVFVSTNYNSFNILSLTADCYVYYERREDEMYDMFTYGYSVPLNFDLTTGEELSLADIFEPGADYLALLSDAADTELLVSGYDSGIEEDEYYSFDETMLTAPFKGVRPEQKFYIGRDGDIVLLLDYDTPEFYVGYNTRTMSLGSDELDGKLRLYRRSDKPVFENTEESFLLTYGSSDEDRIYTVSDSKSEQPRPNMDVYASFECPARFRDSVVDSVRDIALNDSRKPGDLNALYDELKIVCPQEEIGLSANSSTRVVSTSYEDLISVDRMYYISSWYTDAEDEYHSYKDCVYDTKYLLDPVTGEEKHYSVLFARPEDADGIIEKTMVKNLSEIPEAGAERAEDFARTMLAHIDGANVATDSVSLSFDLSNEEIKEVIDETFGWPEDYYSYESAVTVLDYEDIGCRNLVLFSGM